MGELRTQAQPLDDVEEERVRRIIAERLSSQEYGHISALTAERLLATLDVARATSSAAPEGLRAAIDALEKEVRFQQRHHGVHPESVLGRDMESRLTDVKRALAASA